MRPAACAAARDAFADYLQSRANECEPVRIHLASCQSCRHAWNRYRWHVAATSLTYAELRDFLGDDFMPYLDSSAALADEWNQAAPTSPEQAAAFFRNSTAYLYNLAVWQASGHRPDYTSDGIPLLRAAGVRRVCDYGCGIGNDTLPLLDAGFAVTCCDYDSPSTNFLRWRLTRRGHHVPPILEPAELRDHPAPDALWVIDTLDHLADIDNAVGHLLDQVDLVITENLTTNRGTTNKGFHYHRRPDHITATFASHGLEPGPPQAGHTVVTAWVRPGASRLGHHPPSRAVQARADAWRPEPGAS